jgi:hypothetical protein
MKLLLTPGFLTLVLLAANVPAQSLSARSSHANTDVLPAQFAMMAAAQDAAAVSSGVPIDGNDPLLQPPPLPKGKATLIGGTVSKIDRVHQSVTLKPYGGGSVKVFFDERTHIFRDGVETTMLGIHRGDRVYADTLEDNAHVLAEAIRVETQSQMADAQGQVIAYNAKDGSLQIREALSLRPVSFRVTGATVLRQQDRTASAADLLPGSLVQIQFSPEASGRRVARRVDVFASPGSVFTFAGKLTYLDLSRGRLALQNRTDGKNYEIGFDPAGTAHDALSVGSEVTVSAVFDGQAYRANHIAVAETAKK